jgi:hypothetical protein
MCCQIKTGSSEGRATPLDKDCACVWKHLVAKLILLCSLEALLEFAMKIFGLSCNDVSIGTGVGTLSFLSFFQRGGNLGTHCFGRTLVHVLLYFYFYYIFLELIAPCLGIQ